MDPRNLFRRNRETTTNWTSRATVQRRKAATRRRLFMSVESLEEKVLLSVNPIVAENLLPGSPPSQWYIADGGDKTIQGFSTDISVNQGTPVAFKINDSANAPYRIDIFRMGYYQGNGARLVTTIPSSQVLKQVQPAPLKDYDTGLIDAGNWNVSATWNVPADATSGIYMAVFRREDTGGASVAYFVVRADASHSDLLFQTSDSTWEAYNGWDGTNSGSSTSLYAYSGSNPVLQNRGKAMAVSYNRPLTVSASGGGLGDYNDPLHAEYPMVRWLEANGYDVTYTTDVDSARYGNLILNHKVFMSVGHDEYWSLEQRNNVEAARDAGVNLAFFSGNEIFWKTRWTSSIDASATSYRTIVTYKESQVGQAVDPLNTAPTYTSTGTWRDPQFGAPSDGGRPENALSGTIYMNDRTNIDLGISLNVPYQNADLRFWRNTSVAQLQPGQVATLGQYVVGYEVDEDVDNGFRPAGLFGMSSTTFATTSHVIADSGAFVGPGVGNHSITLYRASSGALVFGAGTVQWSWGLDGNHNNLTTTPDPAMQQATVNLFADMYVQPGSLQPGLLRADPSTDATAPYSVITSPTTGSSTNIGSSTTITGTATDAGGGVVAGVEVSTDGGRTWHPASGRGTWSYTWIADGVGPVKILSRAVDDSGNLEIPTSSVTITQYYTPTSTNGLVAAYNFDAGTGTTLVDASGRGNTGTISGATWTTGIFGQALSFNGANSWVTINSSSSLNLTNGMTLEAWVKPGSLDSLWATVLMKESGGNTAAYGLYATSGSATPPYGYITTSGGDSTAQAISGLSINSWSFLTATYDGSVLKLYVNGALASSSNVSGLISTSSGVLRIGGNSIWDGFFNGAVDQVRIYSRPLNQGEIRSDMATPIGGAIETTAPTGSITSPAAGATVSGTATLSANVSDNVMVASVQYLLNGSLLGSLLVAAPFNLSWDTTKFANGSYVLSAVATDIAGNTTQLSSRTILVNNPVDTVAPTVRLTNPGTSSAHGLIIPTAFAQDDRGIVGVQFQLNGVNIGAELTNAPYRFAWDTSTVADGVYALTAVARDAKGNRTTSSSVSITIDNTKPTTTPVWPLAGAVNITTSPTPIKATFNESVSVSGLSFVLMDSLGNHVGGSFAYDANTRTVSFVPNSSLEPATTYTVQVSGATDAAGNASLLYSWSFNTTSTVLNASLWNNSATPDVASAGDGSPTELGVRFTTTIAGYITGIRFYKGSLNVGSHVGHLWDAAGNLLGSVTFTNESASGWQTASFSQAVPVLANTPYVVSYLAPSGGYSYTSNYFSTSGLNSGVLYAPGGASGGGNGLFGAPSTIPTSSYNGTNYWVDVVFSNVLAPYVTAVNPTSNATGVATTSPEIHVVFSKPVVPSTITFTLKDASGNTVPAVLSYDSTTATLTPSSALSPLTTYTVTISGAQDLSGTAMPDSTSWSFTTAAVDTTAPTVISRTPTPGATSVGVAAPAISVLAGFSEAIQPLTVSFVLKDAASNTIPTTVTYDTASRTVALIPNSPLTFGSTYTVTLSGAQDLSGNVMAATSWSFTTGAVIGSTLWNSSSVPAVASADDGSANELGVKFSSTTGGFITGVRFYKGPLNIGTHVAHVWAANDTLQFGACPGCNCGAVCFLKIAGGTLLASATFTNETASGWQEVQFAQPILVMPNTTYIVSYSAPNGGYSYTSGYFNSSGVVSGVLSAPGSASGTTNGVFGAINTLPSNSFNATNYWVTPVFSNTLNDVTPPTVVTATPAANSSQASTTSIITATFSEFVNPASAQVTLRDAAGNLIPATVSWPPAPGDSTQVGSVSITPHSPLAFGTTYTVTISNVMDLAGNTMTAPFSWSFTTASIIAQTSIWPANSTPASTSTNDSNSVALGVKFQSHVDGYITGIRFYKGAGNTGTHVGNLWDASGNLLATATFTNETASGWQNVVFQTPVFITAGTTYVASYFAPNGHYAADSGYFASTGTDNGVLSTLTNSGVFAYGSQSSFPNESYNGTNYWVDVFFTNSAVDLVPPTVVATTPGSSATLVSLDSKPTATFSEPLQAGTLSFLLFDALGNPVSAALTYDSATQKATLTPTQPLTPGMLYSASITGAKDLAGNTIAPYSWSFTAAPVISNASIWTPSSAPTVSSWNDSGSLEVGVRFQTDVSGLITGIRFYKGAGNTGTHVGNLWDASGNLLATATFTNETASGWQQVNFSTPVAVSQGTTYVASYYAPNGHYAADSGYFTTSGVDQGVLHALSNASGGNGVFAQGTASAFPNQSFNATNYWVDVVFSNVLDAVAPSVVSTTPSSSATNVALSSNVVATLSKSILPNTVTFVVTNAQGGAVPGVISYNDVTHQVVFTPSQPLSYLTTYTATLSGAADLSGNIMAPTSWSFTTAAADVTPPTVVQFSPSTNQTNVPVAAILTTIFSESVRADALSFTLRNSSNQVVAATIVYDPATFTLTLAPTNALSPSTTYTATLSGVVDLSGNALATQSWSFTTAAADVTAPTVVQFSPSTNQTNVSVAAILSATFSKSVQPNAISFTLRDSSNQVVAATAVYDPATFTLTLDPTNALSPSTTYTATLSGVVDLSGNALATQSWSFTTAAADVAPPTVVSSTPTAGTTGVSNHPVVSLVFSENVQLGTMSLVVQNPSSQTVAGSLAYDAATHTVTFFPATSLAYATVYTVTASGARDLAGNLMTPVSWSFTTGTAPDSTPPTVTAVTPSANATSVPLFQNLTATFSEDVQPDTISFLLHNGSAPIASTVAYDPTTRTVTLRTSSPLSPSTTYNVFLSGAKDLAGNTMSPYGWAFTTPSADTSVLSLSSQTPGAGATGVPVGGNITATFSKDVVASSLSFVLKNGSTTIAASVSYDAATRTAILDPNATLAAGTTYTATLSGARDLAGNVMASTSWSFTTTAADTTAPTATSRTPASNATGVAVASNVTAVFSETVVPSTISLVLRAGSTTVASTVTYDPITRTVTLDPNSNLSAGTTYTVTLSGAKDLSGNTMASTSWSFTTATADTTAPTVTVRTPSSGASGVPVDSAVTATFSEGVQASTISFTLRAGSTTVASTVTYDPVTRTVKLDPNSSLSSSTTYTATLSGAKDLAGNAMSTLTWTFTTASSPSTPYVSSRSPVPNDILIATTAKVTMTFNTTMTASTISSSNIVLRNASNTVVSASVTYNTGTRTATLSPSSSLTPGMTYTVTLSGIRDSSNRSLATTSWSFTVAGASDATTPTVATRSPSSGDTGVPVSSLVTAVFSEDVVASTISLVLKAGSTTVASSVTYDAASRTVYLDPSANLSPGTTYTVTLSGAQDLSGNTMTATSWSFTTASADTTAPTVTARFPASGTSGTPVASTLSATFNKDVLPSSVSIVLKNGATTISATATYDLPSRTIYLDPSANLSPGTTYTVTLSGAQDLSGNTMTATSWSFTTASTTTDTTAPTVTTRFPSLNGVGVPVLSVITATFSESIQPSTVNVILANAATSIPASIVYDAASRTVGVRPDSPLTPGALYTITLSGAQDLSGNVMAATSWSFTTATADTTAPTVTSRTPASGAAAVPITTDLSATFSEQIQANSAGFVLSNGSTTVAATLLYDPGARMLTLVPSAPLASGTTYTATLSGVKDLSGNTMATVTWSFTTATGLAASPPTVATTSPAANASNVLLSSNVVAQFDSDVQASTISFTLSNGVATIPAVVTYDPATRTVTLDPTATLAPSTVYTVTLSGAQSLSGTAMTSVTWTFTTTAADVTAPSLSSTTPANQATGVGIQTALIAVFSEQVQASTIQFTLTDASGAVVPITLTYDPGTRQAFLNPTIALAYATTYTATLSGARDLAGNLIATTSWTFTTAGDTSGPTIVSVSPTANQTGTDVLSSVSATFSKDVQPGTIVFSLVDASGNAVASTMNYDALTRTATLTPVSSLAYSTTYTATVAGAKDLAGNAVAGSFSWSFTTGIALFFSQTSVADFSGGTAAGTTVTNLSGGEVQLASAILDDFLGTALSNAWTFNSWGGQASATVADGVLSLSGAVLTSNQTVNGIGVEGRVNFASAPYQHFGVATGLAEYGGNYWAIFSTNGTSDRLFARVNVSGSTTELDLGALPSGFHNYRIQPVSGGFQFLVDGVLLTTISANIPSTAPLHVAVSTYNGLPQPATQVDWVRLATYNASGTFASSVLDSGKTSVWGTANWTADLPSGTSITVETSSSIDGVTWTSWTGVIDGGTIASLAGRYLRYRVSMTTSDPAATPALLAINLAWS